jgi:hypothetical protein
MKKRPDSKLALKFEDINVRVTKVRRVTFSKGPLLDKSVDGHPCHEGETAYRVRSLGTTWGVTKLTKKSIVVS